MHRISKHEQGFTHYVLLLLMVLLVGVFAYIGAKRIITSQADTLGDFSYLATHPQAAAQPTAAGRILSTLKAYNGKIYAGYGDYNTNTGPINITPLDPTTNTFVTTPALTDGTEDIALYRVLNSKLYAASIDPSYLSLSSYYASGDSSGNWTQKLINQAGDPVFEHVFDINTLTGSDLWLAGSNNGVATVSRSTDGGSTWVKSLEVPVANTEARFYAIGSFNGKLYVQASEFIVGGSILPMEPTSHVFNGTSWTTGPSLSGGAYYFWHPETFAGKMVYLANCPCNGSGATNLRSLDTNNVVQTYTSPASFYEYTIDGSTLYALGSDGKVYSTTNLSSWYVQASGITTGRSIAVLNGQIYVGTTDSKIYKAPVNANPPLAGSTGITSSPTTTKTHGGPGGGGSHKK